MDKGNLIDPAPQPVEAFTRTSIQVALMQSFLVRLEIARYVEDVRSECSFHMTRLSNSPLVSNFFSFRSFRNGQLHLRIFQLQLFSLLTYGFLLALHHPLAIKVAADPKLYFSRKVSLEVALSLMAGPLPSREFHSLDDDYAHLQAVSIFCDELIKSDDKSSKNTTFRGHLVFSCLLVHIHPPQVWPDSSASPVRLTEVQFVLD